MGGAADLVAINFAMSFLPKRKRHGALRVAKTACRVERLESKRGWAMVNLLAEHLKSEAVLNADDAHHVLMAGYWWLAKPMKS